MSADKPNAVDELIAFVEDTMAPSGPGRWGVELPDGIEPFEKRLDELSLAAYVACALARVSLEALQAVPMGFSEKPHGPMRVPLCYGRGGIAPGNPPRERRLVYIDNPEWLLAMRGLSAALDARTRPTNREGARPPKGRPGAPGYPREIRAYAMQLRRKHPRMTARAIRKRCLEKFPGREGDMPDAENFRRWLNRGPGQNRAN
jgi:hypothetical protein